jgi:hypothetical protein
MPIMQVYHLEDALDAATKERQAQRLTDVLIAIEGGAEPRPAAPSRGSCSYLSGPESGGLADGVTAITSTRRDGSWSLSPARKATWTRGTKAKCIVV